MLRSPLVPLVLLAAVVVDLHVYTAFLGGFGLGLWEYNVAFLALTVAALAFWPLLRRRRVTSIGLSLTGTAVVVTSAFLLWGQGALRRWDLTDWMRFWHSAWSFAFTLLFLAHAWLNRVRLLDFLHRLLRRRAAALAYGAALVASLALAAATWHPALRGRFTEHNYSALVTAAAVASAGLPLAAWLASRAGDAPNARRRRRILVDATMLAATALALGTGFVVLYLKHELVVSGLRHVSFFWHSATGAALVALAVAHAATNARPLLAHARRIGRELREKR